VYLESLWCEFARFADKNFHDQIQRRGAFNSRVWEMRLAVVLKRLGLPVVERASRGTSAGPDIKIDGETTIWIEAVAPATTSSIGDVYAENLSRDCGTVDVPATTSSIGDVYASDLCGNDRAPPELDVIIRYTGAFKEKWDGYRKYLENGVVKPTDAFVIAISGANLRTPSLGPPPWMAKALYGVGDFCFRTEVNTGRDLDSGWSHAPTRWKTAIASVESDLFLGPKRAEVSAVLHSYRNVFNLPVVQGQAEGRDFFVFHNQFASVPLTRGMVKLGQEWGTEDGWLKVLENHWTTPTERS
jgi:hypothetical protein